MSDNVTKVDFGAKLPKKPTRRRRLLSFLVVIVLVLLAVSVVLFHEELNLDKLKRYVTYFGTTGSGTFGEYTFDAHSANAYASFESGLALSSVGGLTIFDQDGKKVQSIQGSFSTPGVRIGNKVALAFDIGGNSLLAASSKTGELLNETGKTILDADISDTDEICYASVESGYKSVLTVYNNRQKESYKWYSSTQYMPVCAISSGGAYLAAVALGQNNGAFESTATIFKTDETEVYSTLSLGNQLILDLKYLTQRELCAIGESNIQFFSVDGQLTGAYDLKDQYLKGYDMGANGFILLCVNQYRAGNRYSVVTIDTNGNEIANRYIGKEILDISACGNYVAVLTSEEVTIYNKSLEVYQAKENTDAASKVLMRSDGSAILIGGGKAKLYLP